MERTDPRKRSNHGSQVRLKKCDVILCKSNCFNEWHQKNARIQFLHINAVNSNITELLNDDETRLKTQRIVSRQHSDWLLKQWREI